MRNEIWDSRENGGYDTNTIVNHLQRGKTDLNRDTDEDNEQENIRERTGMDLC